MLVECRELYERHIDFAALSAVEAYNHLMDGEKQVVIGLLHGLGDGVKLALVAALLLVCVLPGTEPTRFECTRMVKQNILTAS